MNKNKELDRLERRIKRLRKQIKVLLRYAYYFTPPMELDIRDMIRVSKM
jgi:hypothetical protein